MTREQIENTGGSSPERGQIVELTEAFVADPKMTRQVIDRLIKNKDIGEGFSGVDSGGNFVWSVEAINLEMVLPKGLELTCDKPGRLNIAKRINGKLDKVFSDIKFDEDGRIKLESIRRMEKAGIKIEDKIVKDKTRIKLIFDNPINAADDHPQADAA